MLFGGLLFFSCFAQGQPTSAHTEKHYEWPSIRGPKWDGHSDEVGLAEGWPESGPPVLWTQELGQGYSSFAAWGDSIATQYQTLGGQYVACLDAKTGKTRWQYRYAWPYEPAGVYPGPRSTPCYSDGFVYFTGPSGLVGCLDAATGSLKWSLELYERFESKPPGFGYGCSPIIDGEMLFLPVGGKGSGLVAFNKQDGKVLWQSGDDEASYASVLPIRFQDRALVIGYMQNGLVCHDAESGEQIWRRHLSSGYDEHSAWPLYQEPYLWISGPFQSGSELLELSSDPKQPVKMVRRSKLMSNDIFSSVLHEGAIYGFDLHEAQAKTHRTSRGIFRCIDFLSGDERWSVGTGRLDRSRRSDSSNANSKLTTDEPIIGHSTVIVADGKLIMMNDLGELILARADSSSYQELARIPVLSGEMCWTQPCLANGRLFVRNHSRMACLLLADPTTMDAQTLANTRTTRDIPQSIYRDWASAILSIEPEYLFDLPTISTFVEWYVASMVGVFGVALLICAPVMAVWSTKFNQTLRVTQSTGMQWIFWPVCFVLGAMGTTLLSHWLDRFIFTWPVCLYVAWHMAIGHLEIKRVELTWRKRVVALSAGLFWLMVCIGYFLLCKRLSLLFEWAFLVGFLAALPLNMVGNFLFRQRRWSLAWRMAMCGLAFTAFYWSSVGFLYVRYHTTP